MKTILYPGTFDPITFGHIDLIKKALKIGDRLIVAISENSNKYYLFNSEERVSLVRKSLFTDLKMSQSKIKIISFNCLTTALCKKIWKAGPVETILKKVGSDACKPKGLNKDELKI